MTVGDVHRVSAARVRCSLASGGVTPEAFRTVLAAVPPPERDAWVDLALGIEDLADDGPDLPRGCTPYLPCSVEVLLRMVERAAVHSDDVFVDVGSGVGRAMICTHLCTGATAIGLEVQPHLVRSCRDLVQRLSLSQVSTVQGDAMDLARAVTGSVFFLYCPFGGERLAAVLNRLHDVARTRSIRVCCVDLPLPPLDWLAPVGPPSRDLVVYESTISTAPYSARPLA